ncbi:4Fe-4S dicluster domain-containing protein [Moorella sp. Hama-1]|uniref:4Fe-4S dicluster domain-containing protein n=1 Tax=Moorella sp. Hama-1 TaxID=2138101 RepID=UPI000D658D1E|nr:4Fe-4S dicluster domain-containing protein [Moorella sp. Hama-1]MDN5362621.1 NADH-quinone oxidoreductase subunit [Moorella sp. (in: firmicutes)]
MPYRITNACIACGDCTVVCPQKVIIEDGATYNTLGDINATTDVVRDGAMDEPPEKLAAFYRITAGCNNCGRCREVCPAGAIVWEDQ